LCTYLPLAFPPSFLPPSLFSRCSIATRPMYLYSVFHFSPSPHPSRMSLNSVLSFVLLSYRPFFPLALEQALPATLDMFLPSSPPSFFVSSLHGPVAILHRLCCAVPGQAPLFLLCQNMATPRFTFLSPFAPLHSLNNRSFNPPYYLVSSPLLPPRLFINPNLN